MWGWTDTPLVLPSGTHLTSSLTLVFGEARDMLQHCPATLVLEIVVRNFLNKPASFFCQKYETIGMPYK